LRDVEDLLAERGIAVSSRRRAASILELLHLGMLI